MLLGEDWHVPERLVSMQLDPGAIQFYLCLGFKRSRQNLTMSVLEFLEERSSWQAFPIMQPKMLGVH